MYNVAVVFGGATPEHSISIITAIGAIKNLSLNFNPVPIYIDTQGRWVSGAHLLEAKSYKTEPTGKECFLKPKCRDLFVKNFWGYNKIPLDCALMCLHGGEYEGGAVQGVFKLSGIPFTSPDILSSAVCMDKIVTKTILNSLNIATPKFVWGTADDLAKIEEQALKKLKFPLIVKPARCGSSVGIRRVERADDLTGAMKFATLFDTKIVVEEALTDFRELNISLMRSKDGVKFSSVEEIKSEHNLYTFDDKYTRKSTATRVVPAEIPLKIWDKIIKNSQLVYDFLGMDGVVRFDFLVANGTVYLNEVNTIPGSFAFYLWKGEGVSFAQLMNIAIKNAIAKGQSENKKIVQYNSDILQDLDKIRAIVEK